MALYDVKLQSRGFNLQYVIDAYDLWNWFNPIQIHNERNNPHYYVNIHEAWEEFFYLTDGKETCAVLSPFTIIEFFNRFAYEAKNFNKKMELLSNQYKKIEDKLRNNSPHMPKQERDMISDLYNNYLNYYNIFTQLTQPRRFKSLRNLYEQGKVQMFDPQVPKSAQAGQLLDYNQDKTKRAIDYLHNRRREQTRLSSSLDAYHFILIQNSLETLNQSLIIPNITSSGYFTRCTWYLLKYDNLPTPYNISIPEDWNVRSGDVPPLVLSSLKHNDNNPEKAVEYLEEASTLARIIKRDLYKIYEIRLALENKLECDNLRQANPIIMVSTSIVDMLEQLYSKYLAPLYIIKLDINNMNQDLEEIKKEEMEYKINFMNKSEKERLIEIAQKITDLGDEKNNISESVKKLNLPTSNVRSYIAPIGEGIEEYIDNISDTLGIDMY
jgi:hypothetical protein